MQELLLTLGKLLLMQIVVYTIVYFVFCYKKDKKYKNKSYEN